MHGKGPVIEGPLARRFAGRVVSVQVDTDAFGTFTGERARTRSPMDTAIAKARAGMALTGFPLGLASEGSFGPHPLLPFVAADLELLVLVDDLHGIVITERARSLTPVHVRESVAPGQSLTHLIRRAQFPGHALTVRPDGPDAEWTHKALRQAPALHRAITAAAGRSPVGRAIVESDLRAHCSPTRRAVIAEAARRLAERAAVRCPACACPGWGVIEVRGGLPCASCRGDRTHAPRARVLGCPGCGHEVEVPVGPRVADPATCDDCNP